MHNYTGRKKNQTCEMANFKFTAWVKILFEMCSEAPSVINLTLKSQKQRCVIVTVKNLRLPFNKDNFFNNWLVSANFRPNSLDR